MNAVYMEYKYMINIIWQIILEFHIELDNSLTSLLSHNVTNLLNKH